MTNNDRTKFKLLENDLIDLLRRVYKILDQCNKIDPKRTLSLCEALLESIQNRIKLLSQNQYMETGNGTNNGKA